MDIGKSIKIACIQNDVRQGELAEELGISTVYMSRLATNKCPCKKDMLETLAAKFEMPVSEFIALGE